ncbi:expressed unknown protein [Seminavis robusta]|uniref:Uncharacterized protein n=1 Tax=Seminavis robusta TaxID=568900 RepID=A0A9N8E6K3_9STRA|nr:expressed unknown protein [Seminavis robusta]|eukprot:Sro598_g173020.1 n/a (364) ;mRNA; r:25888-26979
MPRLEVKSNVENANDDKELLELWQLREMSPLHTLVISGAPLEMIRLVLNADPKAMNEDIFRDACRWTAKPEVIDFLKKQVEPSMKLQQNPKAMAALMFELFEKPWGRQKQYQESFRVLFTRFPEALLWSRPSDGYSPFRCALEEPRLADETKCLMIAYLPVTTTAISIPDNSFNLRSAVVSKLQEMKNLRHLSICSQDEASSELVEAIGAKLATGQLESLTIQLEDAKSQSYLMPIFDCMEEAGNRTALEKLNILIDMDFALLYQDRMLEILQWNTTLKVARIGWQVKMAWDEGYTLPTRNKQEMINYYTALNYGRDLLHDPQEAMMNLMDMMIEVADVRVPQRPDFDFSCGDSLCATKATRG